MNSFYSCAKRLCYLTVGEFIYDAKESIELNVSSDLQDLLLKSKDFKSFKIVQAEPPRIYIRPFTQQQPKFFLELGRYPVAQSILLIIRGIIFKLSSLINVYSSAFVNFCYFLSDTLNLLNILSCLLGLSDSLSNLFLFCLLLMNRTYFSN